MKRGDKLFHKIKADIPDKADVTSAINPGAQFCFQDMTGLGANRYNRQELSCQRHGVIIPHPGKLICKKFNPSFGIMGNGIVFTSNGYLAQSRRIYSPCP